MAGAAVAGKTMTVTQSSSQAILNWANFNIASGYTVNFVQPSRTASVLNNIWSANESKIAGALNSNGQVILYNQNGILFDNGAQINVGSLTATTLNYNGCSAAVAGCTLFTSGVLSGTPKSQGSQLPAAFEATPGTAGTITVNPGAVITSSDEGSIILLGSAVTNKGTITTPDGQTLIGAGNQVYLAASTDPAMRGLLIEVNSNGGTGTVQDSDSGQTVNVGTVTNSGAISAPRGNVTLAGFVVNQAGTVSATTSVSENGSVYLLAGDNDGTAGFTLGESGFGGLLPTAGGTVNLEPGSVTEVLPDTSTAATITVANLANFIPSRVEVVGQSIDMQGNSTIRAPGGEVALNAAADPYQQIHFPTEATNDGGTVYLDSGSTIDVSGLTNVPVSVTQNIIQVTLEGDDLEDDPLLRNGFLHGSAVTVNLAVGSTLFDVSPYAGNVAMGIDQVLTSAGTITLNSDGSVIARAGSTLNVSGGSVAYQGGYAATTTKLVGANGKTYDISDAPTNIEYTGTANGYSYTDPTWGTVTKAGSLTYYAGFTQGENAGEINVLGPEVYLQGAMLATTTAGAYQRTASTLPLGGLFQLGCACTNSTDTEADYRAPAIVLADNASSDILGSDFNYLADTLSADLQATTTLSPSALTDAGFDRITLYSNGGVTLSAGSDVNVGPFGSLSVTTDQSININANIRGAGAAVSLITQAQGSGDLTGHPITLAPGVNIDVSGSWINDSPTVTPVPGTAPEAYNGGSVTLTADGNIVLGGGSLINVSGGGWINSSNQLNAGAAGKITLGASYNANPSVAAYTGTIDFGSGSTLLGNSLTAGAGGALTLKAGSVTVGNESSNTPGELLLTPDFFSNRGFSSYDIVGENDVVIGSTDPGNQTAISINPLQETLEFTKNPYTERTGANIADFSTLTLLPQSQRSPANITFASTATSTGAGVADNGDVVLSRYATVTADPGGSVTLAVDGYSGNLTVDGTIFAPAGSITLQLGPTSEITDPGNDSTGYLPYQQLLLGPQALLAAPAYAELNTQNALGYVQGSVLTGGSVTLLANKGYVVTDPGSVIDVSGTAATIDVINTTGVKPTVVAGNAGAVDIEAREGLILQGSLLGQAATYNGATVAGAGGGTLTIGLDLYDYVATYNANELNPIFPTNPRTLTLSSLPASQLLGGLQSGQAVVSTGTIESGGFDNVVLKSSDVIAVDGNVSLSARASLTLDSPVLSADANSSLQLTSPYVALGNYSNALDYFDTPNNSGAVNPNIAALLTPSCSAESGCTGSLSVNAQLIDVRGVSGWTGFASESLSSTGDIRFVAPLNAYNTPPALETPSGDASYANLRGGLNVSGDLTLQAQQAYPTTNTDFTITADSSVTILPASGTASTPLSAGGTLTINAPTVTQEGVLRAPMGEINLQALNTVDPTSGATIPGTITLSSGSITSVSADGTEIPYGSTVNGQEWVYSPTSGITEVITAPPAKAVNLNGANVNISSGATLDLSGGGDLTAYEFMPGEGGSTDVLIPGSTNTAGVKSYQYAIVPSLGSSSSANLYSPLDAQIVWQQGTVKASNTPNATAQDMYISGVPGLAAGYYALLPARYALLPGAYAVSIVQSNSDIAAGSVVQESNGSYLVAGKLAVAGTSVIDSQTSTVLVAPSSVVNQQSQYTSTSANVFFTSAAATNLTAVPSLPADAGALNISATANLTLDGKIDFTAASFVSGTTSSGTPITVQGAGGAVSIQSPNIAVVDASTSSSSVPAGALQVSAQSLDALGAQTLVLGGSVQSTAAGEEITAGVTQTVTLDNTSVALRAPDIILVAQNTVTIGAGAQLSAKGTLNQPPSNLVVNGAGAVLNASSGALPTVTLESSSASDYIAQNASGVLAMGSGANVSAAGSLLLYSTGNTTAQSDSIFTAPALGLYSSHVSLGDVPTGANAPSGLNLTAQLLDTLGSITDLTIGSTSTIDFYGTVDLGSSSLQAITFNTSALLGYDTASSKDTVTLQAGAITLENNTGIPVPASLANSGTGSLTLSTSGASSTETGQITLGPGSMVINGFNGGVTFAAAGDVQTQGTGALTIGTSTAAVNVSLVAAALTAGAGSNQSITTYGSVTVGQAGAGNVTLPAAPLGGTLSITANSIAQNGIIDLPGGTITLIATGASPAAGTNLELGNGSVTSVAGAAESFVVTDAVAPGGTINLTAMNGNVLLDGGSTVNVSGATSADGKVSGNAGSLNVIAGSTGSAGQFTYDGTLLGSAATGELQGNFSLDAGSGLNFSALNTVLSNGGFTGAIQLRTRGDSSVAIASTDTVTASSFELTADTGSIDIAGTINTSGGNALSTDGGAVSIWAGNNLTLESGAKLLADAGAAGPIGVNGTSLAAQGGDVTLGTQNGNIILNGGKISMLGNDGASTDGTLTMRAPRTADGTDVQIQEAAGANIDVDTRKPVVIEGFKAYTAADLGSTDSNCGTAGGTCDVMDTGGMIFTDAAIFAGNASNISTRLLTGLTNDLGSGSPVQLQVRAGIEVDSSGDLTVGDPGSAGEVWDLNSWNAALGVPVNVTLRAGNNLIVNASLSDGFTNSGDLVQNWTFGESATNVDSATYRLTAGADLSSADPLAVIPATISNATAAAAAAQSGGYAVTPGTGNLIITPGTLIRTGDGSINIAAGGDVLLGFSLSGSSETYDSYGNLEVLESDPLASVIYTAGIPTPLTAAQSAAFSGLAGVSYPTDGGNITVSATDIRSAPSAQLVSDWLWRSNGNAVGTQTSTSWGVNFSDFKQGIGALGGGNISLAASGNIVNVSAVIPANGELLEAPGSVASSANLLVSGGGALSVQAGGNIESGVFEDDWGNALISAGGALNSGTTFGNEISSPNANYIASSTPVYTVLLPGSGDFSVNAQGDMTINFVSASTALPESLTNDIAANRALAYFYDFSSSSVLNLTSVGGDVTLDSLPYNLPLTQLPAHAKGALATYQAVGFSPVYPPTLNIAALSGDLDFDVNAQAGTTTNASTKLLGGEGIGLFPSATGNLSLLAEGSIYTSSSYSGVAGNLNVNVFETDPADWPSALAPATAVQSTLTTLESTLPAVPLHQEDTQPIYIVADTGSISVNLLTLPKAADIVAGGDINSLNLAGKNLNPADVTLIEAGGSINYLIPTVPITNTLEQNQNGISVAGPGFVEVLAGGSINLGDGNGIVSTGNLTDPRLSSAGATVLVGAGLGTNADGSMRQPDNQAFINTYLAPSSTGTPSSYESSLIAYMQQLYPVADANLSDSAALTAFNTLTPQQQLPLLSQVLNAELSATGIAHNTQGTDYSRGYDAINTLFPTTDANGNTLTYQGDLNMFYSQVKTEQGGDIDLMVPGGSVVVGLPNPSSSLSTVKQTQTSTGATISAVANLGILVIGQGAIEGFANENFEVNQSRILTLEGGDIILWASNGNIDAGKGAKSASAAPPPLVETDSFGNTVVNPANDVTGSGIGQLLTGPDETAGLVNLIAPKGTVNAGDAGIRVAGDLNIAAVQVIGASNITVSGTSTGVPVSDAGALSGALSGANSLSDAGKTAVAQLTSDLGGAANLQQLSDSLTPAFIVVKMFCLGVDCQTR